MQLTTKLNIGDTIWHINNGCINELEITEIHISVTQCEPTTKSCINYSTDARYDVFENDEGKTWWKTRDGILNYVVSRINAQAKVKSRPEPNETKSSSEKTFDDYFREPKSKPTVKGLTSEQVKTFVDEEFTKLFGPEQWNKAKRSTRIAWDKFSSRTPHNELNDLYDQIFGR